MTTKIFQKPVISSRGEGEKDSPLSALIRQEIAASPHQAIPFSRYMEQALYAADQGYYRQAHSPIGYRADYITAPEISSLFAHCLARNVHMGLQSLQAPHLIEVGPGNGSLAADILLALEKQAGLPECYWMVEQDKRHQERQYQTIKEKCPHLLAKVCWSETFPTSPVEGVIIANELLDALPVNCYRKTAFGYEERWVRWQQGKFMWHAHASCDVKSEFPELIHYLDQADLPLPYDFEISPTLPTMLRQMAACLHKGMIFLIDYGYPRAEYYHPQRNAGHLVCYYQQQMNFDPFFHPGQQDITAHVDFTFVAEAAHQHNLEALGYCSQAAFLLSSGLLDEINTENLTVQEAFLRRQAIQLLTSPSEMGTVMKVMALGKGIASALIGFNLQDDRVKL